MDPKPVILVVEDERVVAEDIQRSLEQMGYSVPAVSASGEDAIKKVEQYHPNLILMDIVIRGDMNGIETAEKIVSKYDVPIVYLTAYADKKTLEEAKQTGPFGYILKPFNSRELKSTIEMAIYKHGMDQKLRENEAWLSTTLRSIGDGVIATDADGKIRFINKIALEMLGYKNEEVVSRKINEVFKFIDKNNGNTLNSFTAESLNSGKIYFLKSGAMLLKRDGSTVPIDGNSSPILDERGNIIGAVKVFRDISARLQAEEAIRLSEEKYRTLFETIAQGVLYYNRDGKIISGNPAAEKILEVDVNNIYGKSLWSAGFTLIKEDGTVYDESHDPIAVSIKEHYTVLNKVVGLVKDGSIIRWLLVDVTPQFDHSGNRLVSVVMSFSDITKRREAELALHNKNIQLSSLVHLAHEISTTLDIESILKKTLDVLIEKTEFTSGSIFILNKDRTDIDVETHSSASPKAQNRIRELFLDKNSFYRRSLLHGHTKIYPLRQLIAKDPQYSEDESLKKRFNQCLVIPIQIDSYIEGSINLIGKVKNLPIDLSDDFFSSTGLHLGLSLKNAKLYEEIKITLKQLKETQNKLIQSEKLAGLGALASNIVHEIGNPLAAIDNSIQVLQRKLQLEGKLNELMNIISWETERLIRTINELREFSKPKRLNFAKSDLRQVIKKAIFVLNQDVELIFGKKIIYSPPKELPDIHIDPDAIEQVAINLIKNGLQAVKEGGVVKVFLNKNGKVKDPCVILKVEDDGEGIAVENFENIFEPYFSTKARGMGLGMHIVKTNVELHGGSIKIDSKQGQGTAVTVSIPVKR
ncbi:PAS domain S-box protein [bacterium]|nr:PAS domain S-box protein [bacterium]